MWPPATPSMLRRLATAPGSEVGGDRLSADLPPAQPSSVSSGRHQPSVPPHLLGPAELWPLQFAGRDGPLRLLLPQVSTFTPQQSQPPPQTLPHSVSALLFDKTGRQGSGPALTRPAPAWPWAGTHPAHRTAAAPPGPRGTRRSRRPRPRAPGACSAHSSS